MAPYVDYRFWKLATSFLTFFYQFLGFILLVVLLWISTSCLCPDATFWSARLWIGCYYLCILGLDDGQRACHYLFVFLSSFTATLPVKKWCIVKSSYYNFMTIYFVRGHRVRSFPCCEPELPLSNLLVLCEDNQHSRESILIVSKLKMNWKALVLLTQLSPWRY